MRSDRIYKCLSTYYGYSANCDDHEVSKQTGQCQGPGQRQTIFGPGRGHGSNGAGAYDITDDEDARTYRRQELAGSKE